MAFIDVAAQEDAKQRLASSLNLGGDTPIKDSIAAFSIHSDTEDDADGDEEPDYDFEKDIDSVQKQEMMTPERTVSFGGTKQITVPTQQKNVSTSREPDSESKICELEALLAQKDILLAQKDNVDATNREVLALQALVAQNHTRPDNVCPAGGTQEPTSRLHELETLLAQKDTLLAQKDILLAQKDTLIAQKDTILAQRRDGLVQSPQTFSSTLAALLTPMGQPVAGGCHQPFEMPCCM